jgi:hypothetical protein
MPSPKPHAATFRFYGRLRALATAPEETPAGEILPAGCTERRYMFGGRPALRDAIEAQGVPHPEVDLLLANGDPASLERPLHDGDRISAYPRLRRLAPDAVLRPDPPEPLRFVLDVHLGRLARYLRMLGIDARYANDAADRALARVADREGRILLTRDRKLLCRRRIRRGAYVRAADPEAQLREVAAWFDLEGAAEPWTRCMRCNGTLTSTPPEAIRDTVPAAVYDAHDTFWQCTRCDQVYWAGSHVRRMRRLIDRVFGDGAAARLRDAGPTPDPDATAAS